MNVTITNLRRNVIYTVKVRSENRMKTINNSNIGPFSEIKQFFTGTSLLIIYQLIYDFGIFQLISEKPFISNYAEIFNEKEKSLNISWIIADEMKGSMFEFIIILTNSSNICQYLIHATCTNCEDPLNQVNYPIFPIHVKFII